MGKKKIVKRNGDKMVFDKLKVKNAVLKAFTEIDGEINKYAKEKAADIANIVSKEVESSKRCLTVEQIQDIVVDLLMRSKRRDVAVAYIEYRYKRNLVRESNTTDETILNLIRGNDEYWKTENSNKNSNEVTVQRDYIAGATSTDISRRLLLPKDIVEAHDEGIIHFHDMDYYAQNVLSNCSLCNLEDMLQNGTVINDTMIEKPHRFVTAMTIATQIITAVTSSQYGGVSITLTHLAPFVRSSYDIRYKEYRNRGLSERKAKEFADKDIKKEIEDGVQTFNYQCNSMSTTNGQAPFLTVFMYLGETEEYKYELSLIIEEFLKQRIVGLKNEKGVYITPAFPKLIYVLEEDNIRDDSEYWYLTELSAKCTAKRMVPDYISEKKMKELKIDSTGRGNCYPCMGCVDGKSIIDYKIKGIRFVESFEHAWDRLGSLYEVAVQPNGQDLYINTPDVEIYDNKVNDYVKQYRIIRNTQSDWYKLNFTAGRYIDVTNNHPFEVEDKGVVLADDINIGDKVLRYNVPSKYYIEGDDVCIDDKLWAKGLLICDGCYDHQVSVSLGLDETDICERFIDTIKDKFELEPYLIEHHRGIKGDYVEVRIHESSSLAAELLHEFGALRKKDRQIPNYVFEGTRDQKMSFMAGMIDADGYINSSNNTIRVQLGSTNEELAGQQLMLAMDLGLNAAVYQNRYNSKDRSKIRYRVEFNCTKELSLYLACQKKIEHFNADHKFSHNTSISSSECEVKYIESYYEKKYSYDVTTESEHFMVNGIYSHNCRSFLTPYVDENGNPEYYGRFNIGVVTISLPDVALSSGGYMKKFWKIFEERTELCHKALRCRYERFINVTSDVAPIMWQNGALGRLKKGEHVTKLIDNQHATISLGYAGLYECVKYMTGSSHSSGEGKRFGIEIMKKLNEKTAQWRDAENLGYSLYGTPIESTTYKFAKCLKKRFGDDVFEKIDGKDRMYITNSYHVPVFEKIDPFDKLSIESKFQELSPGGAISYIECADMQNNIPAVLSVMQFIYDNIMYAELNTKSDYCQKCGYDGEIKIIDEDGKLTWECPNCKNHDQNTMNVARRTCGLI